MYTYASVTRAAKCGDCRMQEHYVCMQEHHMHMLHVHVYVHAVTGGGRTAAGWVHVVVGDGE